MDGVRSGDSRVAGGQEEDPSTSRHEGGMALRDTAVLGMGHGRDETSPGDEDGGEAEEGDGATWPSPTMAATMTESAVGSPEWQTDRRRPQHIQARRSVFLSLTDHGGQNSSLGERNIELAVKLREFGKESHHPPTPAKVHI